MNPRSFSSLLSSAQKNRQPPPPPLPESIISLLDGSIAPKYFEPEMWAPVLGGDLEEQRRYVTFVSVMIERIRDGTSNFEEVKAFFKMLNTASQLDYMAPAAEKLKELKLDTSEAAQHPCMVFFLDLVRPVLRRPALTTLEEPKQADEQDDLWDHGLTAKEKAKVGELMFGKEGPGDDPRKLSLFKSTLELGFPRQAFELAAERSYEASRPILRDNDSLPSQLYPYASPTRMPEHPFESTTTPLLLNYESPDGKCKVNTVKELEAVYQRDRQLGHQRDTKENAQPQGSDDGNHSSSTTSTEEKEEKAKAQSAWRRFAGPGRGCGLLSFSPSEDHSWQVFESVSSYASKQDREGPESAGLDPDASIGEDEMAKLRNDAALLGLGDITQEPSEGKSVTEGVKLVTQEPSEGKSVIEGMKLGESCANSLTVLDDINDLDIDEEWRKWEEKKERLAENAKGKGREM